MAAIVKDTVGRFSNVVSDYVKYRPTYPPEVFDLLRSEGVSTDHLVADIGAGTGIFTRMLVDQGFRVVAVEPNDEMRKAAEAALAAKLSAGRLTSLGGKSEATGLDDHSVDVIIAAQAFHWFSHDAAKVEFKRILKKKEDSGVKSQIFLIWNNFSSDAESGTEMMRGYEEALIEYCIDYLKVAHGWVSRKDSPVLPKFFAEGELKKATYVAQNNQRFDLEGLKGRCLSSSYAPKPDHPNYEPLMRRLEALFAEHNENGLVEFRYTTEVFYGTI